MLLQRRVLHGTERRVVDTLESIVSVEACHPLVDIPVRLVRRANDHLRGLADRAAVLLLHEVADAPHRVDDALIKVLHLADLAEVLGGGRLNIDGEPRAEPLACFQERVVIRAGHHLQVNIAAESVVGTNRVHHIEQTLLRGVGILEDPGAEEESVNHVALVHLVKQPREFIHLEPVAPARDPVGVGAIVAVHDAVVGEHHAHQ